jgi:hypothetical protein
MNFSVLMALADDQDKKDLWRDLNRLNTSQQKEITNFFNRRLKAQDLSNRIKHLFKKHNGHIKGLRKVWVDDFKSYKSQIDFDYEFDNWEAFKNLSYSDGLKRRATALREYILRHLLRISSTRQLNWDRGENLDSCVPFKWILLDFYKTSVTDSGALILNRKKHRTRYGEISPFDWTIAIAVMRNIPSDSWVFDRLQFTA